MVRDPEEVEDEILEAVGQLNVLTRGQAREVIKIVRATIRRTSGE